MPHPYLLISSFRGPVWVFYGIGQIWLTHRKLFRIGDWIVRTPRLRSRHLTEKLNQMKTPLKEFIGFCDAHGIQGTIVMERQILEFHWTFGFELEKEKQKPDHSAGMDVQFARLVEAFNNPSSPGS